MWERVLLLGCGALLAGAGAASAQEQTAEVRVTVAMRGPAGRQTIAAVAWLSPKPGTRALPPPARGTYTLLQKNRMFQPHVQVVPVGAVVQFPNADPYFHNVFSLFDAKRFDLGLYEAGSSKGVTFPREGISYIFCNIHPEMSAVILVLSTPFYAKGKTGESLTIDAVPPGDYDLNVWVEGIPAEVLDRLQQHLHLVPGGSDDERLVVQVSALPPSHKDKFGRDYPVVTNPPY